MENDDYAVEIEERRQKSIKSLARYEDMPALARKALKGPALTKKMQEIKDKLDSVKNTMHKLDKLNERRYNELYQTALERINQARAPFKKPRLESEQAESEVLDVSDGK
jgi:hypothetical protein